MKFIKKTKLSKTAQNKLLKVAKLIEARIKELEWDECDFQFDELLDECLGEKMNKWGLEYKEHDGTSNYCFISRKMGIIVKAPYTVTCTENVPKMAIPTVIIELPQQLEEGNQIWIQPLADVSRKAVERFLKLWGDWIDAYEDCDELFRKFGEDAHEGNYALFQRKPVVIDW